MTLLRAGIQGVFHIAAALALAQAACSKPAPAPRDKPDIDPTDTETAECTGVTFTDSDGVETDLTEAFTDGTHTTLSTNGTVSVCPGDWFVRLTTTANVVIEGDHETTTILSGGDNDTVLTVTGGRLTVAGVRIDRGRARGSGNAAKGGGILCDGGARVTVTESSLTNNNAFVGGAIYATNGCVVSATDVVFSNNSAGDDGGTLCSYFDGGIELSRVTIEGGTSRDGGAIFVYEGELNIEDSVISGNRASMIGGAIMSYGSQMTVSDTTFSDNQAEVGGAILNVGDATLDNVRFTGNVAEDGGAVFAYSSATTTGTQCSFTTNTPDDVAVGTSAYTFGGTVDFLCDGQGCAWDPAGR